MKGFLSGLLWGVVLGAFVLLVWAGESAEAQEKVLYAFCSQSNCSDGSHPRDGLVALNGTFYGVTAGGGSQGAGTVFSLDPATGAETVLHSFCSETNCADGRIPYAGLIAVNGTLYGTTQFGGVDTYYYGTVFSLDPGTGTETVLHAFGRVPDGSFPVASLVGVNGTLYGTTPLGGGSTAALGTVFSLDLGTGKETVLSSFCSEINCRDGEEPYGSLIDVNGTLYGTTEGGGHNYGEGAVFSLDPGTGTEKILHSFCGHLDCCPDNMCIDGIQPSASLIDVKGTLYGTTYWGGRCSENKCWGTLFSLDPNTHTYALLYRFCSQTNCTDGAHPYGNLIEVHGELYGTTQSGGSNGGGTVFSFDPGTGVERVLYSFCSRRDCADGEHPGTSLFRVKDRLYGVTIDGGAYGSGTLFSVKTP